MKRTIVILALLAAALPLVVFAQSRAFRVGPGAQFTARSTTPTPSPTPAPRLWVKSDGSGRLSYTDTAGTTFPICGGSTPTIASVNANAGVGATAAIIGGTDTAFELRITTGTGATTGTQVTINYAHTWASKPYCVNRGANVNGGRYGANLYDDRGSSSTTQLVIATFPALLDSTDHRFSIVCLP
jgi:hypothetical protein